MGNPEDVERFAAVIGHLDGVTAFLQQGDGQFLVDRIVFDQEDAHPPSNHLCRRSRRFNHSFRQCEIKRGPLANLGLHPHAASVAFHQTLANRQTDSGSWNAPAMESLENNKNLLVILGIDPDAIVRHRYPADCDTRME